MVGDAAVVHDIVAAHGAGEPGRLEPVLEARALGARRLNPGTEEVADLLLDPGRLQSLLETRIPGARKLGVGAGELARMLLEPCLGYRCGWVDTQKLERQDLTLWTPAYWNQTLHPSRKMAGPCPLAGIPMRCRG